MATVNNFLFKGTRGKLGNIVFFTRNGKTFMRLASEGKPQQKATPHQKRITQKFAEASRYGKEVLENADLKKLYKPRDYKSRGVYRLAFRDAFHAPQVTAINAERYHGLAGDEIHICATDDFQVKSVLVTIIDTIGNIVEQGEAMSHLGVLWLYEAKVDNPNPKDCTIRVIASDFPGNEGLLEITI